MRRNYPQQKQKEEKEACRETGFLLPTYSADIPYVVFTGHADGALPLVPSSQLFKRAELERDPTTTKAQRAKSDTQFGGGVWVSYEQVEVDGQPVATSLQCTNKADPGVREHTGLIVEDFVVIKPLERSVYSRLYNFVECERKISDPLLDDVVLKAELHIRIDLECADNRETTLPRVKLTAAVLRIRVPEQVEQATFDQCPWRIVPGNERYLGDDFNPGKHPLPPPSHLEEKDLLYLGQHRALFIDNPRRNVLIPDPRDMKIGRLLVGSMFWSRRNDAYIAYRIRLKGGRDEPIAPLSTDLNPFADLLTQCTEIRFRVWVRPADKFHVPAFRGFYAAVTKKGSAQLLLGKVLIEDPLLLLIDRDFEKGGDLQVLIRPNRDYSRVAKFSVQVGRPDTVRDVYGPGFLVNRVTGSVFCCNYPLVPLHLPVPDRAELRVGEQITFKAACCKQRRIYVIVKWERAPVESEPCEPYSDGYLFYETLKRTRLDCSDRCCRGAHFGLITDSDEVVLTHAKLNKIPMPADLRVRVRENPDPSRPTFFDVHSVMNGELDRQKSRRSPLDEFEHLEPLPSLVDSDAKLETIEELHSRLQAVLRDEGGGGGEEH